MFNKLVKSIIILLFSSMFIGCVVQPTTGSTKIEGYVKSIDLEYALGSMTTKSFVLRVRPSTTMMIRFDPNDLVGTKILSKLEIGDYIEFKYDYASKSAQWIITKVQENNRKFVIVTGSKQDEPVVIYDYYDNLKK